MDRLYAIRVGVSGDGRRKKRGSRYHQTEKKQDADAVQYPISAPPTKQMLVSEWCHSHGRTCFTKSQSECMLTLLWNRYAAISQGYFAEVYAFETMTSSEERASA